MRLISVSLILSILTIGLATVLPTTERTIGQTCSSSDPHTDPALACTQFESTYCSSSNICEAVSFNPIFNTPTNPTPTFDYYNNEFSLIMVSDIQFYFTNCKNEPKTECVFDGLSDISDKRTALRTAARNQLQCIDNLISTNALTNAVAVFDNGDMTNKGKGPELTKIEDFHATLSVNSNGLPFIPTLGNHDYISYGVTAAVRLVKYLETLMTTLSSSTEVKIRNMDFEVGKVDMANTLSGNEETFYKGSLCYTIEFGPYAFIMTHWAGAVNVGEYSNSSYDATSHTTIDITAATQWLKDEIVSLQLDSNIQKIYIVPHSWRGLDKWVTRDADLQDLIYTSVVGIFSGHDHDAYGESPDWIVNHSDSVTYPPKTIPLWYAGSASYQKFITVTMHSNGQGVKNVDVYDSATGSACTTTTSSPNNDDSPSPSPPPPSSP